MLSKNMRIILVEDNIDLCDDLCFQLNRNGYHIDAANDAQSMDRYMATQCYSIAILDIGLPGENGLSIATRLRQEQPKLGIILLTARGEINTKIQGLTTGADSYLVKPVDWRELAAVIESLHRRIQTSTPKINKWQLTQAGRELISPTGVIISLTSMEAIVMRLLTNNAGQTVSRNVIIDVIAGQKSNSYDPRRLEVGISRLRQKIVSKIKESTDAELGNYTMPIKSVRGVGYIFTQDVEDRGD